MVPLPPSRLSAATGEDRAATGEDRAAAPAPEVAARRRPKGWAARFAGALAQAAAGVRG